jgi:hypothetical protein
VTVDCCGLFRRFSPRYLERREQAANTCTARLSPDAQFNPLSLIAGRSAHSRGSDSFSLQTLTAQPLDLVADKGVRVLTASVFCNGCYPDDAYPFSSEISVDWTIALQLNRARSQQGWEVVDQVVRQAAAAQEAKRK